MRRPWLSSLSKDSPTTVVVDITVTVPLAETVDGLEVIAVIGQRNEQTVDARATPHEAER
jgi:hypothetical protein